MLHCGHYIRVTLLLRMFTAEVARLGERYTESLEVSGSTSGFGSMFEWLSLYQNELGTV